MKGSTTQVGTLVAAFLASLCCVGPIVLGVLGVSSLGFAAAIAPFRPWLLGLTGVFLVMAFYFAYRPQRVADCGPDGTCLVPPSRRGQRISLWIVTVLTLVLATYPRWSSSVGLGAATTITSAGVHAERAAVVITLDVHGMTCTDCEQHVVDELRRVPGVLNASVSYATEEATVDVGESVDLSAVSAAVERAGYRASNVRLVAVSASSQVTAKQIAAAGTETRLSGHWVGRLAIGDRRTSDVVIDLGRMANRWVGEFDLHEFEVEDYPVFVKLDGRNVRLNLTAAEIDFAGILSASGDALRGIANTRGNQDSLILRRDGEPRFSADFLALEATGEDSTRVSRLGPDGAELRQRFNADRGYTRLLMLLSPT